MSSHPLFPAFAALWFAALFGLGSLAIRPAVLEAALLAARADLVLPAATPPLGNTGRLSIALAMALCGGMAGLLLARSLTHARPAARARDSHPDAPARRPISAHEEFGEAPLDATASALPYLSRHASPVASEHPTASRGAEAQAAPIAASPLTPPPGEAVRRILSAELDTLSHLELVERLAISMQRRRDREAEPAPANAGGHPTLHREIAQGEPVLTFPDQSMRSTARHTPAGWCESPSADLRRNALETEKALRSALATLQRSAGAA